MKVENPFWLLHNWMQSSCNQIAWFCDYYEKTTAVGIAVGGMSAGVLLTAAGAAMETQALVVIVFLAPLALIPHIPSFRMSLERTYRKNTKTGCKNLLQKEWPLMILMKIFLAFSGVIFSVLIATFGASLMMIGVYVLIVIPLYFLATDPAPKNYSPAKKLVYS